MNAIIGLQCRRDDDDDDDDDDEGSNDEERPSSQNSLVRPASRSGAASGLSQQSTLQDIYTLTCKFTQIYFYSTCILIRKTIVFKTFIMQCHITGVDTL